MAFFDCRECGGPVHTKGKHCLKCGTPQSDVVEKSPPLAGQNETRLQNEIDDLKRRLADSEADRRQADAERREQNERITSLLADKEKKTNQTNRAVARKKDGRRLPTLLFIGAAVLLILKFVSPATNKSPTSSRTTTTTTTSSTVNTAAELQTAYTRCLLAAEGKELMDVAPREPACRRFRDGLDLARKAKPNVTVPHELLRFYYMVDKAL